MPRPFPYRSSITCRWIVACAGALLILAAAGCQSAPSMPSTAPAQGPAPGLMPLTWNSQVLAQCAPPVGWAPQPLESGSRHTEQLWLSPSTNTAYGVAHINLPLPLAIIGIDRVLNGIVDDMADKQKSATVLYRQDDPRLPGLHVEIKGGDYRVRANLTASGWDGWFVYASTSNDDPIDQKELDLAQSARDHTILSLRSGK